VIYFHSASRESKKAEEGSRVEFADKTNFEGFTWSDLGNEHTWKSKFASFPSFSEKKQ